MNDFVIALAGNPNVGKSTVFNALTGMRQHTGNWPGKTVECAKGKFDCFGKNCTLIDLPGTYSLLSHSQEEEIARDFICFEKPDCVIVVCDATCMERNLNLVLQILELTGKVIVCVNLMDEAEKFGVVPDLDKLSLMLGVPVVGTCARSNKGIDSIKRKICEMSAEAKRKLAEEPKPPVVYPDEIEKNIEFIKPYAEAVYGNSVNGRWLALRLLSRDYELIEGLNKRLRGSEVISGAVSSLGNADGEHSGAAAPQDAAASEMLAAALRCAQPPEDASEIIVQSIFRRASAAASYIYSEDSDAVKDSKMKRRNRRFDKVFTGKVTGIPIMLLLLCLILWITIEGANYPSAWLSEILLGFESKIYSGLKYVGCAEWFCSFLCEGVYRVVAWVVSVMLPPMAIFFPLFTILEDFGYLPRVAFNLDKYYKKSGACGKQSLTHCMGFGCNAVGVTGCRIIDSPRERLIAILTNCFAPCNGRFPMIITVISVFFAIFSSPHASSILSAAIVSVVIVVGVFSSLAVSKMLSRTLLKGEASSFAMEMPPYRTPQVGKVIVRSFLDRTFFVLGRAITAAAPAGAIIWILTNVRAGAENQSLFEICAGALEPLGQLMGLDGIILMAFILGFPANEIVLPLIIMGYTASGSLTETGSIEAVRELLVSNGWTHVTAICVIIFALMHWPCATTCMTIKKETASFKWTLTAILLPTLCGIACCIAVNGIATLARVLF
ncbi:MAG: ferrous iron transport protein B [Clostridia bacterium]|nr:ferrous iron transport protein B [Clostridia bacterium]